MSWFLLVAVAVGQRAAVITISNTSVSTGAGVSAMDAACGGLAMVCTNSRNFSDLWQVPIYSPSARAAPIGRFPYVSSQIYLANNSSFGGSYIYTGCNADGSWNSSNTCSNWTSVNAMDFGGVGSAGANDTSWLDSGSPQPCGTSVRIYCLEVIPPVAFVYSGSVSVVLTKNISDLDQYCRSEDSSYPFTFALVCQSSRNWPALLSGANLTDRFSGAQLGASAFTAPFSLATALHTRTGGTPSLPLGTGCTSSFTYPGQSQAGTCNDFTNFTGPLFSSASLSTWVNDGVTRGCISFNLCCVRSTNLVVLPSFPTSAPSTAFPTSTPSTATPTTQIPTNTPTNPTAPTSQPTMQPTNGPTKGPTSAPTTSPTTKTPTNSPTNTPTNTPAPTNTASPTTMTPSTLMPTPVPTPAPSLVPVVLVVTNFTGNITQNVSIPGNVSVVLPNLLFIYSNGTSIVQIGRGNLSDFVPPEWIGGGSVVSVVVVADGQVVQVANLTIPVEFIIPRPADCEARRTATAVCMWWDTTRHAWRPDNCSTTAVILDDGTPATQCKCNHLTDFAVLLNRATPCAPHFPPNDGYVFFAVVYLLLALYCLVVVTRLQLIRDRATWFLRSQHISIGAVAIIRMLSCFRFYGLLGENLVLAGILTALPYLVELWIFTRLASTWLGMVEFTLLTSDLRWEKIRPLLYGVNTIGSLFTIALFIAFLVELDPTTALVGTIGIALVYIFLSAIFLYYSNRLVNTISSGSKLKRTTVSSGWAVACTPSAKILFAGRGSAFCFGIQALSSILALALGPEFLAAFTILFLAFNCIALICLLLVYYGAVAKGLRPKVAVPSVSLSGRPDDHIRESAS